jgi:23S rRNA pseudouridine2457 synthase
MPRLLLLNKPYGVTSQFSSNSTEVTLASLINKKGFYAAGRLDKNSEGLLLLTDNGKLQNRITNPDFKLVKTYLVQLEGLIDTNTLKQLSDGILLKDGRTKPAEAVQISTPSELWERNPPIRFRKNIPTSWIRLKIYEGKNRQIRRMTAALGFPTLRLVRISIGEWQLGKLRPGQHKQISI